MNRILAFFPRLARSLVRRTRTYFANPRRRNVTIAVVVLLILSFIVRTPQPHVSLAAEPVVEGGFLTNSLLTALVVDIILLAVALFVRFKLSLEPSGFANFMEMVVETLYNLTDSVAGKNARKFFPWIATIFLYVIVSNYSGLIPGVGSIGFYHGGGHEPAGVEEHSIGMDRQLALADGGPVVVAPRAAAAAAEGGAVFVPLFRAPSADLNMTVALALTAVFMTQVYGVQILGLRYFKKFFNFGGKGFIGVINAIVGLLELVLEIAKIISFSFRLFGNIFAGEVLLAVMAFLITFLIPMPFYGLELFVGFIQAVVFMMLTLVFFTMSTVSHDDHH